MLRTQKPWAWKIFRFHQKRVLYGVIILDPSYLPKGPTKKDEIPDPSSPHGFRTCSPSSSVWTPWAASSWRFLVWTCYVPQFWNGCEMFGALILVDPSLWGYAYPSVRDSSFQGWSQSAVGNPSSTIQYLGDLSQSLGNPLSLHKGNAVSWILNMVDSPLVNGWTNDDGYMRYVWAKF